MTFEDLDIAGRCNCSIASQRKDHDSRVVIDVACTPTPIRKPNDLFDVLEVAVIGTHQQAMLCRVVEKSGAWTRRNLGISPAERSGAHVYVESLVIQFDDSYVEQGDSLRDPRHVLPFRITHEGTRARYLTGADLAINTSQTPLREAMATLGMKEGFDIGLEMSGNPRAFNDMLDCMYHGGKIALLGILPNGAGIDWDKVIFKGLFLKGIYGREMFETWYKMTALVQGGMAIGQAVGAFKLFTGLDPDPARLDAHFRHLLAQRGL